MPCLPLTHRDMMYVKLLNQQCKRVDPVHDWPDKTKHGEITSFQKFPFFRNNPEIVIKEL